MSDHIHTVDRMPSFQNCKKNVRTHRFPSRSCVEFNWRPSDSPNRRKQLRVTKGEPGRGIEGSTTKMTRNSYHFLKHHICAAPTKKIVNFNFALDDERKASKLIHLCRLRESIKGTWTYAAVFLVSFPSLRNLYFNLIFLFSVNFTFVYHNERKSV